MVRPRGFGPGPPATGVSREMFPVWEFEEEGEGRPCEVIRT